MNDLKHILTLFAWIAVILTIFFFGNWDDVEYTPPVTEKKDCTYHWEYGKGICYEFCGDVFEKVSIKELDKCR